MDSSALVVRSPTLEQKQSIFFKLPPEMRNRIYEMAFDCEVDSIDLAATFDLGMTSVHNRDHLVASRTRSAAAPPSTALLRSCQKLHYESVGIFKASLQAYWHKDFVFILQGRERNATSNKICSIPNKYLARIRRFVFVVEHDAMRMVITLTWSAEIWHAQISNQCSFQDPGTFVAVDKTFQLFVKSSDLPLDGSPTGYKLFQMSNTLDMASEWSILHFSG